MLIFFLIFLMSPAFLMSLNSLLIFFFQICRNFQCVNASVLNYDCDIQGKCHGHGVSSVPFSLLIVVFLSQ